MGKNKVGNLRQIASINRYTFTEGKEEGIKVIDCDNGKIRFLLNQGKVLDVMQLFHNGTIIIPESVTKIAMDTDHDYAYDAVKIKAPDNSYAIKFAKKNNIEYEVI